MGCKYCDDSNRFLLTEEFVKDIGFATEVKQEDLHIFKDDYSVFVDRGYLRLCTKDSDCLDHGEKIAISFCPMCGRNL
jgi:hypothetical protein